MLEKNLSPSTSLKSSFSEPSHNLINVDAKNADVVRPEAVNQNLPTLLTNADVLIKNHEYALGFHLVREALNINPFHPFAIKLLIKLQSDNFSACNKLYQTLMQAEFSFENLMQWGHYLYKNQKDDLAQAKYEQALEMILEPSDELFEIYKNLGNIYLKLGDFEAAEEMYNKAFVINPLSSPLNVNIGTLEISKNEIENAQVRFVSAIEQDAKNDKAWVGLALVHQQKGDVVLAKANLENALEINSTNKTAVHLLANICVQQGEYQKAIDHLTNFLNQHGHDEEMSLVLIHVFCLAQKFTEALLETEKFLLWNPGHEEVNRIEKQLKGSRI